MKKRTGIGFRIISMAVTLSVIAAIIGFIGLYTTKQTSKLAGTMYKQDLLGVQYAEEMEYLTKNSIVTLLAANKPGKTIDEITAYKKQFNSICTSFSTALTNYEPTASTEEEETLLKTLKNLASQFADEGNAMLEFSIKGDIAGANKYIDTVVAPLGNKKLSPAVERLTQISAESGRTAHMQAEHVSSTAVTAIIGVILAGLAVSLTLGITITRSITKPVSKIVNNLSDSSGQIAISSTQLSSSSQEIANGAQEQASSMEETTSSMEELSSMVKQNLGNTRQASLLSEKATEASQNGFNKMNDMLTAMNGISKSTEDIKNVISVIDDIAFQTNMLALNAAVEAARAGEAGMGFAVVADEVKNLANRSSESAKETAAMIKETLKNVEAGMSISKELSEIFKDILANSKKVMEVNREVETASGQQDEGINQINTAIGQFDTVVQANASSAEETASAAEELQGQVDNLNEIVDGLYIIVTGDNYSDDHADQEIRQPRSSINTAKLQHGGAAADTVHSKTTAAHEPIKTTHLNQRGTDSHSAVNSIRKSPAEKNEQRKTDSKKETGTKKEHTISFEDDEEFKPV